MKTIYDFSKEEVLSNVLCDADVKYYMKHPEMFNIYTFHDFMSNLADINEVDEYLDGRTLEEFIEVMKNDMIDSDHRSGYYEGCDYVIEFWR